MKKTRRRYEREFKISVVAELDPKKRSAETVTSTRTRQVHNKKRLHSFIDVQPQDALEMADQDILADNNLQ